MRVAVRTGRNALDSDCRWALIELVGVTDDVASIRALAALGDGDGLRLGAELAGAGSRSTVRLVRAGEHDAVLKLTTPDGEQQHARRELAFYRTLAEQVPVETPSLLRYVDSDEFTALLLSVHTPTPPAKGWDRSDWIRVADDLARLHSFTLPERHEWTAPLWLEGVLARPPLDVAVDFWTRTDAADSVDPVLETVPELAPALAALPEVFVHGDCHVGNLLRAGDRFVWTDWQATGLGSPAGDLSFLWGRAYADGADPPRAEMMREYAVLRGLDPVQLHRSLVAAELGTMLFGWPAFAHHHPRDEQDRLVRRFAELAHEWCGRLT